MQNNFPKVLFISYAYPPISSPGSMRVKKIAHGLPEHGWQPTILTSLNGVNSGALLKDRDSTEVAVLRAQDHDPVKRFRSGATARANRSKNQNGYFNVKQIIKPVRDFLQRLYSDITFPDRDWIWGISATKLARQHLAQLPHAVIYSTSPSITNHLIARRLKRATGLPWIAEFRDTWAYSKYRHDRSGARIYLERKLEKKIIDEADFLVSVSETYLREFKENYLIPDELSAVIYNGFDEKEFMSLDSEIDFPKFTITHAGDFYKGKRSPEPLFTALKELNQEGLIELDNVAINFYGNYDAHVGSCAAEMGLESHVNWKGYISFDQLVPELMRSFCLLLIVHKDAETLPSKIFDYIACQRPILALAQANSEVSQIISEHQLGHAIQHEDIKGIKTSVTHLWNEWLSKTNYRDRSKLSSSPFRNSFLAKNLAGILDKIVDRS